VKNTGTLSLRLNSADNVVVARTEINRGTPIEGGALRAVETIPAGHKIAVEPIALGHAVIKYGSPIGIASRPIGLGQHVHTHNLKAALPESPAAIVRAAPAVVSAEFPFMFDGFRRPDGRVGTRNFVGVLTTVNCSATVARMIANSFSQQHLDDYPGVDGVVALTHTSGCGMSTTGEGFDVLRRTLAGYAIHPNFAGVLILGLGCEQNQVAALLDDFRLRGRMHVEALVIQDAGGTRACVAAGIERVTRLLRHAAEARRRPVPASELMLALECGGSDGYSGISANPALGVAADLLVAQGGTVVLSETPEIIGAEHILIQRAASSAIGQQLLDRIKWWRDYTSRHGVSVSDNPSEGNRAGGITTIFEKALGAVAKAGFSPLQAVYEYGQPIDRRGLVFMDSPGYDPVAVTGQVASGCNIVCFTTGRGSVFGCRPVPSIKLSTNSALSRRMSDDVDIDCGGIVDGNESVQSVGRRIFEQLLATASGQPTCSEALGFGSDEFVPWQLGAVL
jgi:altronate dehydratase